MFPNTFARWGPDSSLIICGDREGGDNHRCNQETVDVDNMKCGMGMFAYTYIYIEISADPQTEEGGAHWRRE